METVTPRLPSEASTSSMLIMRSATSPFLSAICGGSINASWGRDKGAGRS